MDDEFPWAESLACPEPGDMAAAAARLAPRLPENLTLQLDGPMGAGKTFFTAALAEELGVKEKVTSPTYDLVNSYQGDAVNLVHVDACRLKNEREAEALCVEDLLEEPWLLLVEWPENAPALAFGETWRLFITTPEGGGRVLRLCRGVDG